MFFCVPIWVSADLQFTTALAFVTGEIQRKGVVVPFTLDIYHPILSRLAQEGIKATEKIKLL